MLELALKTNTRTPLGVPTGVCVHEKDVSLVEPVVPVWDSEPASNATAILCLSDKNPALFYPMRNLLFPGIYRVTLSLYCITICFMALFFKVKPSAHFAVGSTVADCFNTALQDYQFVFHQFRLLIHRIMLLLYDIFYRTGEHYRCRSKNH